MGRLFGTDGIRGVANRDLTCELALRTGAAAAAVLTGSGRRGKYVLGSDTRISSDMLSLSIAAGLCSMGADVLMLGVIPTPAVAYLTRRYGCDAGVVISASHNPPEFNGIKLFSKDGMKLPDDLEEQIETLIASGAPLCQPDSIGRVSDFHAAAAADYTENLRAAAQGRLDGLRIAIDCANGAASVTAESLFSSLGAEVHLLSCSTDGKRINMDCGSTHMESLSKFVRENGLDAGIAFDGDADRCLCVDELGNTVDGDMMLAICAIDMKKQGRLTDSGVVGTVMSNLGFVRFCAANGITLETTRVGDRYVLEKMLQDGCMLGGEQSGHLIFPEFATTGDGQLTAIQILSILRRSGCSLSALASIMTRYPQHMINIPVSQDGKLRFYTDPEAAAAIEAGKRLMGDAGRILVRTSGTEPLIRIMAEGDDDAQIRSIAEYIAGKLRRILS